VSAFAPGRVTVWGVVCLSFACAPRGAPTRPPRTAAVAATAGDEAPAPPPGFAAARVLASQRPERIRLVFSVPVDPATVEPAVFRVVTRDGRWATAQRAYLDPSDRPRAGWSLVLEGDFGVAERGVPWSVTIVGDLHAADGRSLRGEGVEVLDTDAPVQVVAIACPGAALEAPCDGRWRLVVADGLVRQAPVSIEGAATSGAPSGPDGGVPRQSPADRGGGPGARTAGTAEGEAPHAALRGPEAGGDTPVSPVVVVCVPAGEGPASVVAGLRDPAGRAVSLRAPDRPAGAAACEPLPGTMVRPVRSPGETTGW